MPPQSHPNCRHRGVSRVRQTRAFTILELLSVIAIVGIMAALGVANFTDIGHGAKFTEASYKLSGLMEQARSYARAQNTFVYLGIAEYDQVSTGNNPGTGRVLVSVVASKDGTRIYDVFTKALKSNFSDDLVQIHRLVTLDGLHIPEISPAQADITDLSQVQSTWEFSFPLKSTALARFSMILEFSPNGTVTAAPGSSFSTIGLRIEPHRQGSENSQNQATLTINGYTGAVQVNRL